jgi:iron complex transport system substrate-binding protein
VLAATTTTVAACGVACGVACTRRPPPPSIGVDVDERGASSNACGLPVVVRDGRGVDVVVRAEPARLVSLLPSHTETLFALGVGGSVVGVDDFSGALPGAGALPRLGGLYDAHIETLLALHPDVVLLSETSSAAAPLERGGLTVWCGSAATFDDVPRVIESIGAVVCRRAEAERLVRQIAADVAEVEARTRNLERVRVYYELDASLYTVGPRSFVGTMIAKAGGQDIVPDGLGDFPKISPEAVIAADPAVIFGVSLDDARARPGWNQIAAVRTGHVYALGPDAGLVARPGPRIAEGLRVLLRHIHPEVAP